MKRSLALILALILSVGLLAGCGQETNEGKGFAFADEDFGEDLYVIGMRKGEDALTKKINETLDALCANGKASEISKEWFGEDVVVAPEEGAEYPEATDGSWDYIVDKGTLIVGLDDTFAPMGFRDEGGNLVGFDIDLANALGEELGITIEFQPIDWDAKEMELNGKNIDVIWNGMSKTPEREELMNLSRPYLNNSLVIMTMEGSEIKTKADLVGKKVGTQAGSAGLEVIKADAIYADIQSDLTEYKSYDEALMDLEIGRLDAVIVDKVLGHYKASKKQ